MNPSALKAKRLLWSVALCVCALSMTFTVLADSSDAVRQWPLMGQGLNNWRMQPFEQTITASNVFSLSTKWAFTTGSDVSATPTVMGDALYFPDWSGNLYAVRKDDGQQIWVHKISEYDNHSGAISRVSPAVHNGDLIVGDILDGKNTHDGANVMAVSRQTGILRWITHVDTHPAAVITGSPVVVGDVVYVGVSSNEESLAVNSAYPCCSFRGSMVALDANTGHILWKTYTLPDNQGLTDGYSGNAIWQPPAIDLERNSLYVGTGNNYEVPDSVKTCLAQSDMSAQSACFDPNDHFDSALALDLTTGQIKWSHRLQGLDVWTVACLEDPNPVSCPEPNSPDYDLSGSGPNLLPGIVGFGQKSGMYWALNPANGDIVWSTMVGPGSTLGGIQWGTATDGERIYVAITNGGKKPYPLINGQTVTSGAWSALDVKSGRILWQTPDPDQAFDMGSVSVANGVLYAPSFSGRMLALNAFTGGILWSFQSGGSVLDGPSIVDGVVYWGSGYRNIKPGIGNNKLFAFSTRERAGLPPTDFTITNYQLVRTQPAAGNMSSKTYRAVLLNPNMAFASVTATLTSLDPFSIRVAPGQGTLAFAPVPAQSQVTSSNTFTIILDSTVPLDPSKLQWTFQTTPAPPVANPGPNQTVKVGSNVSLDGSGSTNPSGNGALTYSWRFISRPAGTTTVLTFVTSVMPTFVADVAGTYVISLTASNGAASSSASVTIIASADGHQ